MYKACSRCGKIHEVGYGCNYNRAYKKTHQREARSKYSWQKKSEEIRNKSNNLCSVCKEENIYTYNKLEVHHIISIKDDKERVLDNYNLICLCSEHHKMAEAGKIDKDYLFELARKREDNLH